MLKINNKIVLSFLIPLLFIPFLTVSAQLIPELENIIILNTVPTNPNPEEQVTIYAKSFSIDIDTSTVSWFVDDVLQQQSIGGFTFEFITKNIGDSTKIDIVVETSDGSLETEQITIRPTDIDLIWQARTLTHPLYDGKSIASVGSPIEIEAIPHFINDSGRRMHADELIYSWRVDNKALPNASGRGKNTIVVTQTKPVSFISIEVEIESPDKTLFGKRSSLIPIHDSELLIYENNPLLGILFNNVIGNLYSLTEQETRFIVYPFFMSITDRNSSNIDYLWKLNNEPITLGEDKSSIVVNHTGVEEGEAEISVSVQNFQEIFQKSDSQFKIRFGGETSLNF